MWKSATRQEDAAGPQMAPASQDMPPEQASVPRLLLDSSLVLAKGPRTPYEQLSDQILRY